MKAKTTNDRYDYRIVKEKRQRERNAKDAFLTARQSYYRAQFRLWRIFLPIDNRRYRTYKEAYTACIVDAMKMRRNLAEVTIKYEERTV